MKTKNRKKITLMILIQFLIISFLVFMVYIYTAKSLLKSSSINGEIFFFIQNRNTTIIKLKDEKRFRVPTINYKNNQHIDELIKIGYKLIKNKDSDTLKIISKENKINYYYLEFEE